MTRDAAVPKIAVRPGRATRWQYVVEAHAVAARVVGARKGVVAIGRSRTLWITGVGDHSAVGAMNSVCDVRRREVACRIVCVALDEHVDGVDVDRPILWHGGRTTPGSERDDGDHARGDQPVHCAPPDDWQTSHVGIAVPAGHVTETGTSVRSITKWNSVVREATPASFVSTGTSAILRVQRLT